MRGRVEGMGGHQRDEVGEDADDVDQNREHQLVPTGLAREVTWICRYVSHFNLCRSPHDSLSVGRREDQKTGADGLGGNFRVHRSRSLSSETALPLRPSLYYRFVSTVTYPL